MCIATELSSDVAQVILSLDSGRDRIALLEALVTLRVTLEKLSRKSQEQRRTRILQRFPSALEGDRAEDVL
jgi:hypothetical protein